MATLFGRVELNASRIGVSVTQSSAPSAIVPHVGCIVICRSAPRVGLLPLFRGLTCARRVTRVVQAKATADIVEVDGRPIAAAFQVCCVGHACMLHYVLESSRLPALMCRHRSETISFAVPQAAIRLPDVDVRQKIDSLKMLAPLHLLSSLLCCSLFVAFCCPVVAILKSI